MILLLGTLKFLVTELVHMHMDAGWAQCMQRYPSFKNIIKGSAWLQRFLGKR